MPWLWLAPVLLLNFVLVRSLLVRLRRAAAAAASARERALRAEAALAVVGGDALLAAPDQTVLACGSGVRPLLGEPITPGAESGTLPPCPWVGKSLAAIDPALGVVRGSGEDAELTLDRDGRRLGCRVVPLRAPEGEALGYLTTWRDVGAERERQQREERERSRQQRECAALESLDASLMIVDAELRIARMNAAMCATLATLGPELAARLGRPGAHELIGAPVALFDTAEWQAADLQRPDAAPRSVTLELGGRLFEVRATPLRAADARWLGAVLHWQDRTDAARVEAQILQVVADVNRYDLVPRVPLEGCTGTLATLGAGVNQVADTMAGIVSTVTTLARQVSDGAALIAGENRELGEQATRAADSLAGTVHSTSEMTAAIRQLTDSAHLASRLAGDMRSAAVHGGEVVHGAREAMSQIERTSRRVADVVNVIDTLAFQTNLLALNAAIEAAHAGPHGGGFAVVAAEVRALAARSKDAAREVHALIDDTLRCVEAGSGRVTQSEQALNEIIGSAKGVEAIVTQIDAVAVQQAEGIARIDAAVLELQRFTRDHEALVERTARESGALAEQSADLAGLMRRYRLPDVIVNAPKLRARKRPEEAPAAGAGPQVTSRGGAGALAPVARSAAGSLARPAGAAPRPRLANAAGAF